MAYVPYEGYTSGATELQNTLLRQAAMKQKAMMDALQQKNIESEIQARNENAAAQSEARQALAEQRTEAKNEKHLGMMVPGQVSGPDVDFLKSNFPQLLKHTDAVDPQAGQPGFGVLQPQPAQDEFLGTPAYQAQQKRSQGIQSIINDVNSGTAKPEDAILRMMMLDPEKTDSSTLERYLTSKAAAGGRRLIFNEQLGKFTDAAGHPVTDAGVNDVVSNLPRPPIGPQPTITPLTDKDGKIVGFVGNRYGKNGAPIVTGPDGKPVDPTTLGGVFRIGNVPRQSSTAGGAFRQRIPEAELKNLTQFGVQLQGNPSNKGFLSQYDTAVAHALAASNYPPEMKALAQDMWANHPEYHSIGGSQILNYLGTEDASPEEQAMFRELWTGISGRP